MQNTKNTPLVSIVVITYNSAKYVLETLESCKAQTYQNLELIISDDCSTDTTVQVCEKWLHENKSRFLSTKLIKTKTNTGISANLNRGVHASSGIWFKLIAGDDLLLKNCIEDNLSFIFTSNENINVVTSTKISFKVNAIGEKVFLKSSKKNKSIFYKQNISANEQYHLVLKQFGPTPNTWFIKKLAFLKAGGCDERFPMIEDRPLKLNLLKAGYKFYRMEVETVWYRLHNDSVRIKASESLIYKNWYLNSQIPMEYTYYYPYFDVTDKIIFKYNHNVAKLFVKLHLNKRNLFNLTLNKLLTYPSSVISRWRKNRIISKFQNS